MANQVNFSPRATLEAHTQPTVEEQTLQAQEGTSLNRDMLGLVTLFLIVVTYHIQNPLLQFERQFGKAFRNDTLQPVMAVGLVGAVLLLVLPWSSLRTSVVRLIAATVLIFYSGFMLAAILFGFNLTAALYDIPQAAFQEQIRGDDAETLQLREQAAAALRLTSVFEYAALIAVLVLWQPWGRLALYRKAGQQYAAALMVGIIVLVLWETLINVFQVEQFLLPRPSVIGTTFLETYPRLVSAGWNTFLNAFWGFVFGCGAGIVVGMLSARFVTFSRALLPLAIAINAIPIIALAPIMNNWFGALNPASKISIVAILAFFPSMISTVRGLNSVDALSMELMRSYAASELAIFRKVRFPSALPLIFSALKVATTLSMIGAIVSEYFGGSTAGLGFRIRDDAGLFKYPEAWSAIVMASLFGIMFFVLVSAVERAMLHWHVSFREK